MVHTVGKQSCKFFLFLITALSIEATNKLLSLGYLDLIYLFEITAFGDYVWCEEDEKVGFASADSFASEQATDERDVSKKGDLCFYFGVGCADEATDDDCLVVLNNNRCICRAL